MILVVDDQADIRLVLLRLLQMEGYEAEAVASGAEAIHFLRHRQPTCIILDIHMPDISGFDVLAGIRSDRSYDGVHVIMCSSADGDVEERSLQMGANAFVRKGSLDWVQFGSVLRKLCAPAKRRQSPTSVAPPREKKSG